MNNILIIDDTHTNIDLLLDLLEDYNIFVATNGKDGLEILKSQNIDLILLDVMMPEMDGFEVAKIVRTTPKINEIPIIFITAKTDEESIEKGFEVGGNDYITKPFKQRELLSRINTQLKLKADREAMENLLLQQSKMAKMGEIIDSVAHQWKQPLNIINMGTQLLKIQSLNGIKQEDIDTCISTTTKQVKHLVETLDEFRNFFKPNKEIKKFNVKEVIEKTIVLIGDELKVNDINIEIEEKTPYQIEGYENEFKHIVLNFINNSKDAFIEKNIENRKIKIIIDGENKKIEFIDNAGGIPAKIIDDIFNLNFTTKKTGSGVGLYLSNQIANKLSAILEVKNIENGVKFIFKEQ